MNNITLAKNTKDPKVLDKLSKDENYYVRFWVAENPNTSPETLKQMAIVENNETVKYYIKRNPNCSEETGRYLLAVNVVQDIMCNVEGKI